MSTSKLLAAIVAVFAAHPEAENVYVCEDGNVFLEERKNLAENHCRSERLDAPRLVSRADVEGVDEDADAAAAEEQARKDADAAAAEEQARKDADAAAAEEQARKDAKAANAGQPNGKKGNK